MPMDKRSRKRLKFCCVITIIILIIFVVISVTLFFTKFKPKDPKIIAHPTFLEHISFQVIPNLSLNVTLGLAATIVNPNYGSFRFKNTTSYVSYHGTLIAEVPLEPNTVPSRGELNVTTYATLSGDKLVLSPYFLSEIGTGTLVFTAVTNLHGKVGVGKIIKFGAKVSSACDISVGIWNRNIETKCYSSIKL